MHRISQFSVLSLIFEIFLVGILLLQQKKSNQKISSLTTLVITFHSGLFKKSMLFMMMVRHVLIRLVLHDPTRLNVHKIQCVQQTFVK